MRALLLAIGSAGDVHPFVGLGLELQQRGHRVTLVTNPYFRPLIDRVGLPFIPVGTAEDYDRITTHPKMWHSRKGLQVIATASALASPTLYRIVRDHGVGEDTVVVAGSLAFAARTAQETLGIRLATVHLQPSCFFSAHRTPVFHPTLHLINRLPIAVKRTLLSLLDRAADQLLSPAINPHRQTLGLKPVRHITSTWWHSPTTVIGMFPEWFAPKQPDWPSHMQLTGFPLFDELGTTETPPHVKTFLETGSPPIVWIAGSGNRQAPAFFRTAAAVSQHLGRRGLLLTQYPEQLPPTLPDDVIHGTYAPLAQVLPRAAALVHHGGIGSAAQALSAGIPQLVRPMAFDQPDNAARLRDLGVAQMLSPSRFRTAAVARTLDALLRSPDVANQCQLLATRLRETGSGLESACDAIEATLDK